MISLDLISQENFLFLIIFIFCIFIFDLLYKKFKKRWRIRKAKRIVKKLRDFNGNYQTQRILIYLRKIDPFVFEELILNCLKERGFKIKRNKRYTGDGGLDGQFWFYKKKHYIQAKRYSNYIKMNDMKSFIDLCKRKKVGGVFVHTGKTGRNTLKLAKENNIYLLSGENLINLILNKNFILLGKNIDEKKN